MSGIAANTRLEQIHAEVRAAGRAAWKLYQEIIDAGETPEWAAMCALQQAPGTRNTDRAFCQGQHQKMERMGAGNRRKMQALAKRAGIQTDGKYYVGGLGRYTDPAAWVSCADDVITAVKAKKAKAEGVINYDASEHDKPVKQVDLAPDIVRRFVRKRLKDDPALAEKVKKNPKKLKEVQEAVVSRHGRRKV